jgi:hypothetical protein
METCTKGLCYIEGIQLEDWQIEMKEQGYEPEIYMSSLQQDARMARWKRGEFTASEYRQNALTERYLAEGIEKYKPKPQVVVDPPPPNRDRDSFLGCHQDDIVDSATTVAGIMGVSAAILGLVGSVVAAPATGGASLALLPEVTPIAASLAGGLTMTAAASGVGLVAGGGAAMARNAMGKPCKSPALKDIANITETATNVTKMATTGVNLVTKGVDMLSKF